MVERTTAGAQAVSPSESTTSGASTGDGGDRPKWAVPCDCTVIAQVDLEHRALLRMRVPERYRHCDFENFEVDLYEGDSANIWNDSVDHARLTARRFAEEYMPPVVGDPAEQGLLLMGPCGVGKTHLAVAALRQIVSRGHSGIFYDYRELLKQIQDSYNPESQATEMSVLEPVLKVEILILDDLGSSKPSAWALETVGHILNTRYNEGRVTIATTNFLDKELSDRLRQQASPRISLPSGETIRSSTPDTLSDRIGVRIRSRLYDMCRMVEIVAPDYRREHRRFERRTPAYRREQSHAENSSTSRKQ